MVGAANDSELEATVHRDGAEGIVRVRHEAEVLRAHHLLELLLHQ